MGKKDDQKQKQAAAPKSRSSERYQANRAALGIAERNKARRIAAHRRKAAKQAARGIVRGAARHKRRYSLQRAYEVTYESPQAS